MKFKKKILFYKINQDLNIKFIKYLNLILKIIELIKVKKLTKLIELIKIEKKKKLVEVDNLAKWLRIEELFIIVKL